MLEWSSTLERGRPRHVKAVTGERAESDMLSFLSEVRGVIYTSLELVQIQTWLLNLLPMRQRLETRNGSHFALDFQQGPHWSVKPQEVMLVTVFHAATLEWNKG